MASLADLARDHTRLSSEQIAQLVALASEWQLLADLAFSDLVLWARADLDGDERGWIALDHIRPTTGPTVLVEDMVGQRVPAPEHHGIEWIDVGDRLNAEPIARLVRHRAAIEAADVRIQMSPLETAYWDTFRTLWAMVGRGEYPDVDHPWRIANSLRVGDAFIRVDRFGRIEFASPNATSIYRRLGHEGDLAGELLVPITSALLTQRPTDRGFAGLFGPHDTETELVVHPSTILVRIGVLRDESGLVGWLVLLRDVTELRLREAELVSKDATIREIHHRVKNNLQTVAALLRLQGRRLDIPEAKNALAEAERRVGSIALVHETLSTSFDETVEFDAIADVLLRTIIDVGTATKVTCERVGSFGVLPGAVATPLAMVLTELIQNATQHAFVDRPTGRVTVSANRIKSRLRVRVSDDGVGMPAGGARQNLGLSIVSTLVEGELGGVLNNETSPPGGTTVAMSFEW